jgi:hypothetical protein
LAEFVDVLHFVCKEMGIPDFRKDETMVGIVNVAVMLPEGCSCSLN